MIKPLIGLILFVTPVLASPQIEPEPQVFEIQIAEASTTPEVVEESIKKNIYCSCIETARALGVKIPLGLNAIDLKPNDIYPHVGGLILLKYGESIENYHAGKVIKVEELGMWIEEGNYYPCKFGKRFILFTDPALLGYWYVE